ncbi:MAG: hypothetical protein COA71_00040 [SAR86 cluster bacterium]|uniref:Peptidase S9 prolyl oligopeptidase catalytic domain-containing protein n=1 Tax=SAR86 cluster bacterium TaxID=2030880 RepID=A0A2A5CHE3_9GAMM|nr:MAG: hypothetical protein COA71_00040 [SAR86 cluster bacterium]
MKIKLLIFTLALFSLMPLSINAQPILEDYARLPEITSLVISPDGTKLAYIKNDPNQIMLMVVNLETGPALAMDFTKENAVAVDFTGNTHVLIYTKKSVPILNLFIDSLFATEGHARGDYGIARNSYLVDIERNSYDILTPGSEQYWYTPHFVSNSGSFISVHEGNNSISIPIFERRSRDSDNINKLETFSFRSGRSRAEELGNSNTIDWQVYSNGKAFIREDLSNEEDPLNNVAEDFYQIWLYEDGNETLLYEENIDVVPFKVVGTDTSRSLIYAIDETTDSGDTMLIQLSLSGEISENIFVRNGTDINKAIVDNRRIVHGVEYAGYRPSYEFFDQELDRNIQEAQSLFPENSVSLVSWADGFSKIVLFTSGNENSGTYYLYDRTNNSITFLASSYPSLTPDQVAEIEIFEYLSKDEMFIHGLLTWPQNIETRSSLPLIVFPHEGPQANVDFSFHWLAQYLARIGYLVFQPNFRGSTGFSNSYLNAGIGELGGSIQQDITDGVQNLIDQDIADPDNICIVGSGFGGYSALMGGVNEPTLYKCVIAISAVSDLVEMLDFKSQIIGDNHRSVEYWEDIIGINDFRDDVEFLRSISPINFVENITSNVLLIHNEGYFDPLFMLEKRIRDAYADSLMVPVTQSEGMLDALEGLDKNVSYVELEENLNWQDTSEARIDVLSNLSEFLNQNLSN